MKQQIESTLRSALIAAGCIAGASAWAVTPGAASQDLTSPPAKPSASMSQGNEYGNAADKNTVQPSQEAVQQDANEPTPRVLDDNAQRQHDRDQGSTPRPSGDTAGTTRDGSAAGRSTDSSTSPSSDSSISGSSGADRSGGALTTRDWDKIDTNRDGSVSPDEMDSWLQNNRAQGGSTQQSAPQK
jgi:hypothetical protein